MMTARISWDKVDRVQEPGRYKLSFGWVTVTSDHLDIWRQFRDATFALYELSGSEGNDYWLGSVELNLPSLGEDV